MLREIQIVEVPDKDQTRQVRILFRENGVLVEILEIRKITPKYAKMIQDWVIAC